MNKAITTYIAWQSPLSGVLELPVDPLADLLWRGSISDGVDGCQTDATADIVAQRRGDEVAPNELLGGDEIALRPGHHEEEHVGDAMLEACK